MFTCIFCRFPIELDDVDLNHGDGRVICLACFKFQVGGSCKRPTKCYRQELVATVERA